MTTDPFPLRPPKVFLEPGERVVAGGAVYCRQAHPSQRGRLCGGYVGAPAPGAVLVAIDPPGERAECTPGEWSLRCARCARNHRFSVQEILDLAA